MDSAVLARLDQITAGRPDTVLIALSGGSWLVPRLYIACHGLKAAELPRLAERYGFERVS